MFQGKAVAAFGQGIVAVIATIIFPLIGLALLQTSLSIDEDYRPQSAYFMPICFFILGIGALAVAIWRFIVAHRYGREIRPDEENPELDSFLDDDLVEQQKLAEKIDEQTIAHNIKAQENEF